VTILPGSIPARTAKHRKPTGAWESNSEVSWGVTWDEEIESICF
jgi:hypothetical protein